jgi:hypothetical protein
MNQRRTAALCVIVSLAVGAVLAVPGIAGFKSGQYVGTTSQVDGVGQPLNVGFDVAGNKKHVNIVYFEMLNINCSKVTQLAGVTVKLNRRTGKFNLKDADVVFNTGYIKGRFKRGKASGTAEFPDRCASAGVIEWEAEKD